MTQDVIKVADYDAFVRTTSQFADKAKDEQRSIALYGLVGEIGSLVAAIKKKILSEGGEDARWDQPNDEIKEELGDALWYCYSTAQIINNGYFDILAADIAALRAEIGSGDERAQKIATSLDPHKRAAFLEAAKSLPPSSGYTFDAYQQLALMTARTDGRVLLEVCLAVLWQLGAELLRVTLPKIEITLNKNVADRDPNVVLGEIAWHLSAMASLYHLSLDDVVASNCAKVRFRSERGAHTPLHDHDREAHEQFPRVFDVAFVRIGAQKSRMYFQGKRLGDDLTDNFYDDDGYRFHDVIHLALIAHLGWSPVVRGLMRRKRKSRNDRVDEVEDGARAKLVEELAIKAIHSEGDRQAKAAGRCVLGKPTRLFPDRSLVNFKLLKTLRTYVDGLEVAKNTFWEWEDAIFEGFDMFYRLCNESQGTIHVDLDARKLTFSPTVCPAIQGITVGLGMGSTDVPPTSVDKALSPAERRWAAERNLIAETVAAKRAILDALGSDKGSPELWMEIEVRLDVGNRVYVKAMKSARQRAWALRAIDYKVAFTRSSTDVICTATAIADVGDVSN
jgi:NTP pyrophosphatase (non-canonical NTP hydrolase)